MVIRCATRCATLTALLLGTASACAPEPPKTVSQPDAPRVEVPATDGGSAKAEATAPFSVGESWDAAISLTAMWDGAPAGAESPGGTIMTAGVYAGAGVGLRELDGNSGRVVRQISLPDGSVEEGVRLADGHAVAGWQMQSVGEGLGSEERAYVMTLTDSLEVRTLRELGAGKSTHLSRGEDFLVASYWTFDGGKLVLKVLRTRDLKPLAERSWPGPNSLEVAHQPFLPTAVLGDQILVGLVGMDDCSFLLLTPKLKEIARVTVSDESCGAPVRIVADPESGTFWVGVTSILGKDGHALVLEPKDGRLEKVATLSGPDAGPWRGISVRANGQLLASDGWLRTAGDKWIRLFDFGRECSDAPPAVWNGATGFTAWNGCDGATVTAIRDVGDKEPQPSPAETRQAR